MSCPRQLGTDSAAQWILSLSFLSSNSRSESAQMPWEISLNHHHGLTFHLDVPWLSVAPECNILHPPAFCTQPFRDQLPSHPEITLTTGGRWHLLNICTVAGCLWARHMQHGWEHPCERPRCANCSWPLLQSRHVSWALSWISLWNVFWQQGPSCIL